MSKVPTRRAPSAPTTLYVDVTDTVRAHWRAGIQRVVLQLLAHLHDADDALRVEPVVWLGSARRFRRLSPEERATLVPGTLGPAAPPGPVPARGPTGWVRTLRRRLRPLRRLARGMLDRSGAREWLRRRRDWVLLHSRDRALRHLVVAPGAGDVLLECDSSWNVVEIDRDELLAGLRDRGVTVVVLVYDLLPIDHPEWFDQQLVDVFTATCAARLRHADRVLAISGYSAAAATRYARRLGLDLPAPQVVPLGADLRGSSVPPARGESLPAALIGSRVVLTVGTVEPRKNHATLLDAMERRWASGDDAVLVVVGRPGWRNDEVIERLRRHPEAGRRLWWFDDADDTTLAALYDAATVVAVPAVEEGFGLPVIEALAAGVPVISSTGGALAEAGGGFSDLVDALDVDAWQEQLTVHLDGPGVNTARRDALSAYRAPSWADAAQQVARAVLDAVGGR